MVSADPRAISATLEKPLTDTQASKHRGLAAAAARPADWTQGTFYVLIPDVSDETAAEITKAKAWPAYVAFFRSLRLRTRKGPSDSAKADAKAGILDDAGIRGLAREIGTTPKAMSRQIAALQAIGILAAYRPPASMTRDPDTGRIVRRPVKAGRVEAARIVLTIGQDHLRPANRQGSDRPLDPSGPRATKGRLRVDRTPSPDVPKGRSDTTSIPPLDIPLTALPAAGEAGRQAGDPRQGPDGPRGGLTAAGQDRGLSGGSAVQRPPNVSTEATPTQPAGTEARPQTPDREGPGTVKTVQRHDRRDRTETVPPGTDRSDLARGPAGDPYEWTRRRLEAQRVQAEADGTGMDPGLGSWLAAYRQGMGLPDPKATTADEAADRLKRSLDELPEDSRQRARDLGQDMIDIEDEARRLAEIVQRRQRDEAATAKAEARAKAEGHRQAYHRRKAEAAA